MLLCIFSIVAQVYLDPLIITQTTPTKIKGHMLYFSVISKLYFDHSYWRSITF